MAQDEAGGVPLPASRRAARSAAACERTARAKHDSETTFESQKPKTESQDVGSELKSAPAGSGEGPAARLRDVAPPDPRVALPGIELSERVRSLHDQVRSTRPALSARGNRISTNLL